MKTLALILFLFAFQLSFGQNAYTQDLYPVSIESNIEYGTAVNYAGNVDTLLLDIYTPVGDNNCNRPCLVLVHGGAWVQGSKNDTKIVSFSEKMAAKGWVVAAIAYRLGTHKPTFYDSMYVNCTFYDELKCWNTTDSAEVIRANYRGQQDTKGAIRFMKGRNLLDSTDISNFFLVGESAGGFISYDAVFMDDPSEKPAECGALANAPNTPNAFLNECLASQISFDRPDLGGINGSNALNGYDSSVEGLGTFISGAFDTGMFANTTDWPSIYMFHQARDVVVAVGHFRILARLNNCFSQLNLCPPMVQFPYAHGSFSVNQYLTSLPATIDIQFDYLGNSNGIPGDCFDNGHDIDNLNLRIQNMADHFAQRIFDNGNTPSSTCTNAISESDLGSPKVYPNPTNGQVTIELLPHHSYLNVLSSEGKLIQELTNQAIQTISLKAGIYFIQAGSVNGEEWTTKVVVT